MLGGLVDVPLCLSYDDVRALPVTTQQTVIACVGNPPGGHCIGQATWQGVALSTLLNEVNLSSEANHAHLFAADGYATSISIEQLQDTLLVYGMNGDLLPVEHGYPARLIVPGLYGYKMPKWIQRVILAETPLIGLWERRGWSASGEVRISSQIVSPHHQAEVKGKVTLQGIAYGADTIKAVEIRVDGGPWMPVQVKQSLPNTLARWAVEWTPHTPGEHRITVRAIDQSGVVQSEISASNPFPNGSSALHAITLRV